MSEPDFNFTFHFSNFQYPLSQDTATFGENLWKRIIFWKFNQREWQISEFSEK